MHWVVHIFLFASVFFCGYQLGRYVMARKQLREQQRDRDEATALLLQARRDRDEAAARLLETMPEQHAQH